MDEAIAKLEQKRSEWRARAEYHRKKSMEYHVSAEYIKRDEERQFAQLAIDNIHGLDYAIGLLKY